MIPIALVAVLVSIVFLAAANARAIGPGKPRFSPGNRQTSTAERWWAIALVASTVVLMASVWKAVKP